MPPAPRRVRRRAPLVGLLASLLVLTSCSLGDAQPAGEQPEPDATASESGPPPPTPAQRLGLEAGWGPTRQQLERAARAAEALTLPEAAGQVIVASYAGTAAPVDLVRRLHLGGVIAFSENVASPEQVRSVNRTLRQRSGRDWPLLLGVDQEGGLVERIGGAATSYPAFMSTGAAGRPGLTTRAYAAQGAELRGLGFTVDFAPVADVTVGPADPAIGSRSASADAGVVADQAVAAAEGYLKAGVLPVVKHFPGHGSVTTDSHVGLPVQDRPLARLRREDLLPFRAAIDAGLPAVMAGHIAVPAVDPGVPASLSRPAVQGLLREDLGFHGVVFSDSLQMAAVTGRSGPVPPAVRVLRSGSDVVLMPPDPAAARQAVVRAVRGDDLPERRLRQAAARTIALAIHQRTLGGNGARPGSAAVPARNLSRAAVTSVAGPCAGPLVDSPVPFGDPAAVSAFRGAAARAGLALGRVEERERPPKRVVTWVERKKGKGKRKKVELVPRPPERVVVGTRLDLVGPGGGEAVGPVVVATGTPYVLGATAAPVRLATYGSSPGAMDALVAVLRGRERAPGTLPVPVPGVPRRGC